jgi:hypothetical protein
MRRLLAVVFVCGLSLAADACCPRACTGTCTRRERPNRLYIVTYTCGGTVRQATVTTDSSGVIAVPCCTSIIDARQF